MGGSLRDHLLTHKDVGKHVRSKKKKSHKHVYTHTHTETEREREREREYLRAEGSLIDEEQPDLSLGKTKPTEHINQERAPLHEALRAPGRGTEQPEAPSVLGSRTTGTPV